MLRLALLLLILLPTAQAAWEYDVREGSFLGTSETIIAEGDGAVTWSHHERRHGERVVDTWQNLTWVLDGTQILEWNRTGTVQEEGRHPIVQMHRIRLEPAVDLDATHETVVREEHLIQDVDELGPYNVQRFQANATHNVTVGAVSSWTWGDTEYELAWDAGFLRSLRTPSAHLVLVGADAGPAEDDGPGRGIPWPGGAILLFLLVLPWWQQFRRGRIFSD